MSGMFACLVGKGSSLELIEAGGWVAVKEWPSQKAPVEEWEDGLGFEV